MFKVSFNYPQNRVWHLITRQLITRQLITDPWPVVHCLDDCLLRISHCSRLPWIYWFSVSCIIMWVLWRRTCTYAVVYHYCVAVTMAEKKVKFGLTPKGKQAVLYKQYKFVKHRHYTKGTIIQWRLNYYQVTAELLLVHNLPFQNDTRSWKCACNCKTQLTVICISPCNCTPFLFLTI